jgi:hypothetical protein
MDRRKALKGLGLTLGFVVATPTVLSILQSCKTDTKKVAGWIPEFFSEDEGIVIENLVDLILPKTADLPGASEVNVAQFIDLYTSKVSGKEEQEAYKKGLAAIINALGKPVKDLTTVDYDRLLAKFLKASKEEQEAFRNNDEEAPVLETLVGLRGGAIWAYKTSEKVGEEILAYDPVPGEQKGCISVEEATGQWGGRAWSL